MYVKVLLELRELFLTAKVVASSNNVLLLDIPCCFFILEDEIMSFVDGRKWIHEQNLSSNNNNNVSFIKPHKNFHGLLATLKLQNFLHSATSAYWNGTLCVTFIP